MGRRSRFAIAGALCVVLCLSAPIGALASGGGSHGGGTAPCNMGYGTGTNTGGTISTTEAVHTCPNPGSGSIPPQGTSQPYPVVSHTNWCGTLGTLVMRKEYPTLSAPFDSAGDRNAVFVSPMGGTIDYVVHDAAYYDAGNHPWLLKGVVLPESWGIGVVSGIIESIYKWNGTECVPTWSELRDAGTWYALTLTVPGASWSVGPQPPFVPSTDALWAKMKDQWSIGQVQSAPVGDVYVMMPTCNWIAGTTLPTQPQYISEDFASQDASGMVVYIDITVEAVPGPIQWSFGDGSPTEQGDSGNSEPHQAQYFGNGTWGSCANEHIYKHVGEVTISAEEQFTVYGWADYYDGSQVVPLQSKQQIFQGLVPFGHPVGHLVQQIEGVPHN